MKSMLPIIAFIVFLQATSTLNVAWSDPDDIRAGQLQLTQTLMTSTDPSVTLNQTFNNAITLNGGDIISYGLSLISYESWMTDEFSFNISMVTFSSALVSVNFEVIGNTFFSKARAHYIINRRPQTLISMDVHFGCYLTSNLLLGDGLRNVTVGNLTSNIANSATTVAKSMIAGMELKNSQGKDNHIAVSTSIGAANLIQHLVEVEQNNYLKFMCVTTVIVDSSIGGSKYLELIEYQTYTVNYTTGLYGVAYAARFDGDNRLFFGISTFNLSMSDTRLLNVETANISYVSMLFETNQMLNNIIYETFYFSRRNCIVITNPINTSYYNPVIYDCVTTCDANQYQDNSSMYCKNCLYSCKTCVDQMSAQCTACDALMLRSLSGQSCPCNNGFVDEGKPLCVPCTNYLSGCTSCMNTSFCTNCGLVNYVIDPATHVCICQNNAYSAGTYCLPYPGCVTAFYMTTGTYCSLCNTTSNYIRTVNYSCTCNSGYFFNSTNLVCEDHCGDSITAYGKCDDGNQVSGDGCSSTCTIEDGYHCSYDNSTNGISTCVLKADISLTYIYSERILETNTANIVFSLSPAQTGLNLNSFKNSITTSLPYSFQKITFDSSTSSIIVQVNYNEAIENTSQTLSVDFSGLSFYADPITLQFTPTGINAELMFDSFATQNTIIKYIGIGLAGVALLIAVFSSVVGLKLIGIELLLPIQLIYFSLSTIPNPQSYIFSLSELQYSNGYNQLASYNYLRTYMQDKYLININYQTQYLLSSNIMIGVLIFILLFLLIHHLRIKYKEHRLNVFLETNAMQIQEKLSNQEKQNAEVVENEKNSEEDQMMGDRETDEDEEKKQLKKKKHSDKQKQLESEEYRLRSDHHRSLKFFGFEVDRVYFIFYVIVINQTMFGFIIMTLNVPITIFLYPEPLNVLVCNLFFFLFIGNLVFISYDQESNKMIAFTCIQERYAYIYIALDFIIIIVLAMTYNETFASYLICALCASFAVLVIIERPYNSIFFTFENIVALYCQLMLLFSLIIICYLRATPSAPELASLVCSYIIVGLIAIGQILSIIRVILKVNFKKAFDDLKDHDLQNLNKKKHKKVIEKNLDLLEEDRDIEIIPPDSVRNGLFTPKDRMIDWESRNTEEYKSIRAQQQEVRKPDQDQGNDADQDAMSDVKVDERLDELEIIKKRLRNNLKMKKEKESVEINSKKAV